MARFTVTLAARRIEWNTFEIEAATAEEACAKAIVEDTGEYEPGDLGESWVDSILAGGPFAPELPVPPDYRESAQSDHA